MDMNITSESNRYPYLLSFDMALGNNDKLLGDITFGREAPGITGGLVKYCVKRVSVEVSVYDGKFREIILYDPANVANGVKITRSISSGGKEGKIKESELSGKVVASTKPLVEVGGKDKESTSSETETSISDEFDFEEFSVFYYGDKKKFSKWDFEPSLGMACLKGTLEATLATVIPDDDKLAFVIDARISINPSDIEPIIKNQGTFKKAKDRVAKLLCMSNFDLKEPVSQKQISVSIRRKGNETDAA